MQTSERDEHRPSNSTTIWDCGWGVRRIPQKVQWEENLVRADGSHQDDLQMHESSHVGDRLRHCPVLEVFALPTGVGSTVADLEGYAGVEATSLCFKSTSVHGNCDMSARSNACLEPTPGCGPSCTAEPLLLSPG